MHHKARRFLKEGRDGSMGGKLKDVRDRNNFSDGRGVPLFTC